MSMYDYYDYEPQKNDTLKWIFVTIAILLLSVFVAAACTNGFTDINGLGWFDEVVEEPSDETPDVPGDNTDELPDELPDETPEEPVEDEEDQVDPLEPVSYMMGDAYIPAVEFVYPCFVA